VPTTDLVLIFILELHSSAQIRQFAISSKPGHITDIQENLELLSQTSERSMQQLLCEMKTASSQDLELSNLQPVRMSISKKSSEKKEVIYPPNEIDMRRLSSQIQSAATRVSLESPVATTYEPPAITSIGDKVESPDQKSEVPYFYDECENKDLSYKPSEMSSREPSSLMETVQTHDSLSLSGSQNQRSDGQVSAQSPKESKNQPSRVNILQLSNPAKTPSQYQSSFATTPSRREVPNVGLPDLKQHEVRYHQSGAPTYIPEEDIFQECTCTPEAPSQHCHSFYVDLDESPNTKSYLDALQTFAEEMRSTNDPLYERRLTYQPVVQIPNSSRPTTYSKDYDQPENLYRILPTNEPRRSTLSTLRYLPSLPKEKMFEDPCESLRHSIDTNCHEMAGIYSLPIREANFVESVCRPIPPDVLLGESLGMVLSASREHGVLQTDEFRRNTTSKLRYIPSLSEAQTFQDPCNPLRHTTFDNSRRDKGSMLSRKKSITPPRSPPALPTSSRNRKCKPPKCGCLAYDFLGRREIQVEPLSTNRRNYISYDIPFVDDPPGENELKSKRERFESHLRTSEAYNSRGSLRRPTTPMFANTGSIFEKPFSRTPSPPTIEALLREDEIHHKSSSKPIKPSSVYQLETILEHERNSLQPPKPFRKSDAKKQTNSLQNPARELSPISSSSQASRDISPADASFRKSEESVSRASLRGKKHEKSAAPVRPCIQKDQSETREVKLAPSGMEMRQTSVKTQSIPSHDFHQSSVSPMEHPEITGAHDMEEEDDEGLQRKSRGLCTPKTSSSVKPEVSRDSVCFCLIAHVICFSYVRFHP
ncbi:hypothetical protein D915_009273, partial [Fasciola hepatica]